ncbi:DoxX family protein [Chryseobacterium profundimaris]|uniref:DoxX-like family protein n=1 Tax=Chryseobacterium profundimaris TaxID=1387275 RepID=A0ABY1PB31_9FLAO|nr:DoxX family protein [Chryseobacterium profundimaris]SMP30017.1 DoxX-like family protein [Chryseobacterium profundimaris]
MQKIVNWVIRLVPVIIMLQTLYFKFSAAPESVYIFSKIGMEPYGRIGIGILELIASILIVIPRTTSYGAVLGLGLMLGAIQFHVTELGIDVQNDGGKLFYLAVTVAVFCALLIAIHRQQIFSLFSKNK